MRKINEIIIHCSDTPESREVTVDDIDMWHRQRGWKGIGYHYVIYLDGSIHNGRKIEEIGAHCTGHNKNSIGICYVGGCDEEMNPKDTRTEEQKQSLLDLLYRLKEKFPNAKIYGHNDFVNKCCPCFSVKDEYGDI